MALQKYVDPLAPEPANPYNWLNGYLVDWDEVYAHIQEYKGKRIRPRLSDETPEEE